jgi:hypothetical protein
MKKTLLTICLTAFSALLSNAQNLEIALDGTTTDISGTTHTETVTTADEKHINFLVTNTGTTTQDFIVTRVILNQPSGWNNYFCWGHSTDPFGGTCYPVNGDPVFVTTNSPTIAPTEQGKLQVYIQPYAPSGTAAHYRYYIGTTATPKMDSVDISLSSVLAVKDIKKDVSLSVSPNPASEIVNIKVSNLDKGSFKIVDVLGNVVAADSFTGYKTVDVSGFRNGVYFVVISEDGMKSINRKLVVKH